MSTKAVTNFVDTILQNFPPFRWEDAQEKAWMDTVIRELSGFSDVILTRALGEMLRTRTDRRIPLVSECIGACLEAKRWLDAEKNKGELPISSAPTASHMDWTGDRFKLANDLVMCAMGREAAKEGWIGALHTFARKNSRLPQPAEIGALKREAKEFDAAYAQTVKGGWEQAGMLQQLGAAMLKRREELTDMVLHGVIR